MMHGLDRQRQLELEGAIQTQAEAEAREAVRRGERHTQFGVPSQ